MEIFILINEFFSPCLSGQKKISGGKKYVDFFCFEEFQEDKKKTFTCETEWISFNVKPSKKKKNLFFSILNLKINRLNVRSWRFPKQHVGSFGSV